MISDINAPTVRNIFPRGLGSYVPPYESRVKTELNKFSKNKSKLTLQMIWNYFSSFHSRFVTKFIIIIIIIMCIFLKINQSVE